MTGDLVPMTVTPGVNVRPFPDSADNLLLALIMDMGHTLFITHDHSIPVEEDEEA